MKKIVNKTKINKKEAIKGLKTIITIVDNISIPVYSFRILGYEILISKKMV